MQNSRGFLRHFTFYQMQIFAPKSRTLLHHHLCRCFSEPHDLLCRHTICDSVEENGATVAPHANSLLLSQISNSPSRCGWSFSCTSRPLVNVPLSVPSDIVGYTDGTAAPPRHPPPLRFSFRANQPTPREKFLLLRPCGLLPLPQLVHGIRSLAHRTGVVFPLLNI